MKHYSAIRHFTSFRTRPPFTHLVLGGVLLCGSSCSSARNYMANLFSKDDAALVQADSDPAAPTAAKGGQVRAEHARISGESSQADVDQLIAQGKDPFAELQITQASAQVDKDVPSGKQARPAEALAQTAAATVDVNDAFAAEFLKNLQTKDPAAQPSATPGSAAADGVLPVNGTEVAQGPPADPFIRHLPEPRADLIPTGAANAQAPTTQAPTTQAAAQAAADFCPPIQGHAAADPFAQYMAGAEPQAEYVGDEYIRDGGDRGLPVHYMGDRRNGLDLEDTVAEYTDHTGEAHVKPSTEALVYAPRFGAVSTATLPVEGTKVDRAAGHHDDMTIAGLEGKTILEEKRSADEAKGVLMRERASGLENRQLDDRVHQTQSALNHVKLAGASEDFQFIRNGQFARANAAVVALAQAAAIEWSDGRRAVIVAHDQSGQLLQSRVNAVDMTGYEDQRQKGDLRIIKVADKKAAHPGEIVTFTIRFDNTGDRELLSVRIVDNLSPRLEYIEGSVDADLAGQVTVDENGIGGKLLTFQFDDHLAGHTGGYVKFQCRVR